MELLKPKMNRSGILRFSAFAYAKLIFWRDCGQTEIGCYGLTETDDPLLITDLRMIKQVCTSISVDFDKDDSIAFVEEMADKNIPLWSCQSVFIHSHPGDSPCPSQADEENFRDNFSIANCSIFYIIARSGKDYARMRFNVPPGMDVDIKTRIDYSVPFKASNHEAWEKEYDEKVIEKKYEIIPDDFANSKVFGSGFEKIYDKWNKDRNGFSSTFVDREESPYIFEEDDKILFWVEEVNEYYEYDKELQRFYDENGRRIKRGIEPEWEEMILEFLTKKEMENDYANIVGGENFSAERLGSSGEIEVD